jgi:CDP-4-dehydro-6-deoxyglucose reductase, E3
MAAPFSAYLFERKVIADGVVDLTFNLDSPQGLGFRAGQFVTLAVGKDAAGRDVRRSYSIASRSDQPHQLRFIIRIMTGGIGSDFFAALPIGAAIEMTGPHGFFVLDDAHAGDVVFAATGTGLAALLPMLAELAARPEGGRRTVYWGLRRESDLFVPEEVEQACAAAGATLLTYLSQPSAAWPGRRGRITSAILDAFPTFRAPTFYLVGNGAMIQELKRGLIERGVERKKQIRTEAFFE